MQNPSVASSLSHLSHPSRTNTIAVPESSRTSSILPSGSRGPGVVDPPQEKECAWAMSGVVAGAPVATSTPAPGSRVKAMRPGAGVEGSGGDVDADMLIGEDDFGKILPVFLFLCLTLSLVCVCVCVCVFLSVCLTVLCFSV